MKKPLTAVIAAAFLSACANSSENVSSAYVSPLAYQDNTCEELVAERNTLRQRIAQVAKDQDDKAGGDAAAVAVAAIVFLPAIAFMAAGEDKSGELARLKGEFDAVTEVAADKDCISAEQLEKERQEAEQARLAIEEERARRRAATTNPSDQ